MTKAELRALIRQRRPGPETLARESALICGHLRTWERYRRAACLAAYFPGSGEADILPILREALAAGKTLLLPRTGRDLTMTFARASDLDALEPDGCGIPAPLGPPVSICAAELILMPLRAVDSRGRRLGQGGGCYDRHLAEHAPAGLRAGVALSHQLAEEVPADPWDLPLEACVCPAGILEFTEREREP